MHEDSADALAGYPGSHLDSVAEFLVGQYRQDAVGPMLGSSGSGATKGEQPAAGPAAAEAAATAAVAAAAASGSMLDLVMEVLGRQALVHAADSTDFGGTASDGTAGGSSLAQLLQGLEAACSTAFGRTPELISPTLALTGSMRLGPEASAVTAGYLPGNGPATAVAAVAWEGQQRVLLLRSSSGEGGKGHAGWEAAVVHLPADSSVAVDLAFYKEGQLALLLGGNGGGSATGLDSVGTCRLALLPQEQMEFVQLPGELLVDSDALQLCEMLLESSAGSGTPLPGDCRQRPVPYPRVQQPLAVSASRGVGCLMAGTQVGKSGLRMLPAEARPCMPAPNMVLWHSPACTPP